MPEVSEAFLREMLTVLADSARAMNASALSMEGVTEELKAQRHAIEDLARTTEDGRDDAIAEVKSYIDKGWNEHDVWVKRSVALFGTAMVLATLLSVPLGRVVAAFLHIK